MHQANEIKARLASAETLADIRTVRREMREPGSVRGLIGQRIREFLTRNERAKSSPPSNISR